MNVVGGALSAKKGPDRESRMGRRRGATPRSAEKRLWALSAGENKRPWKPGWRQEGDMNRLRYEDTALERGANSIAGGDGGLDQGEASARLNLESVEHQRFPYGRFLGQQSSDVAPEQRTRL
jgi:hypothetical protein